MGRTTNKLFSINEIQRLPSMTDETEVVFLEKETDRIQAKLTELRHFIIPSGYQTIAYAPYRPNGLPAC